MGRYFKKIIRNLSVSFLFFLPFSFSLFFSVHVCGAEEAMVVRAGYYENPPKLFKGMQGSPKGIFPEILEEISKTENWQIEWIPGTWKEGLARLESGAIDIMPDVAYSLERAEKFEFSEEPVFVNWGVLYTRAGLHIDELPDLEGKRVAVMRGSIHTDGKEGIKSQAKRYNIACAFVEFDNYAAVFNALQNNLADVGVVNRLFGLTSSNLYDVLPTKIVFNPRHLKFAFSRNGNNISHLKQTIDEYLKNAHFKSNSLINKIVQSYLYDITQNGQGTRKTVSLTPEEEAWIREHPVIKVGIDPEFAPFEFIDKNGMHAGFSSDYIQLLNERLGLNMQIVTGQSWSQIMGMVKQGEIDMLSSVGFSRERSKTLVFSTPYVGFYRMIFSRADIPFISNKRELSRVNLAVQANTSHAAWVQENTDLEPLYYNTLQETIEAVSEGKADALIGNLAACTYWIRKLNLTNLRIDAPVSLERQMIHMAARKDWPQLAGILNKGLISISLEEKETIRNRWLAAGFNVGVPEKEVWKKIGLLLFFAFWGFTCLWFWNRRLKQEVARRVNAENKVIQTNEKLEEKVAYRTRELKENADYLQSIFNAPDEAIFVHDAATGAILDVNQAMLQMYGYTHDQALQLDIQYLSFGEYPYDQEEAEKKVQKAASGQPQTFEWLARKKSGDFFWAEVGLTLTKIGEQSYVIAVVRNIDTKKKAEQALAAEEERLAVTLRSIGDAVITTDTEGKIVLLNNVAEQLTGWSSKEAIGNPSSTIFNIINEKTGQQCESPIQKVMELGRTIGLANHTALIAKDGTRRSIADSGAPIRDKESIIIGVVLVFRDITHEKKMEEELLKIRKLESVGVLAGGIAHDFNNILSAILGNIELAAKLIGKEHKASRLLADARKASSRATKLTKQLLTFATGGDPVKETTSLSQVIEDSANFVLHGSSVSCNYDIPDDLWLVNIDTGQIGQVIQNIIINARHAMPEGGNIDIQCANVKDAAPEALLSIHADNFVKIVIQDTGIGIPGKIIDKIFDPYFSTKMEGSGLGLAICHSIISKHDGHISVQSTPGEGTTFTIYLPASDGDDPITQKKKLQVEPLKPARVMVMDDEEMLRDVAESQLRHLGYDVVVAADGESAIVRYKELQDTKEPIDIIIMDLTIPGGMGGKEAVQEILKINPEVKVIVASGYSNDPVMANYKEYGFSASVSKPFNLQELREVILSVLS